MSLERAAMRGQLAELQQRRLRLRNRIEGDSAAIRAKLNTTLTTPDDLEMDIIDEQFDQLKTSWAELQVVNSAIAKLERELK